MAQSRLLLVGGIIAVAVAAFAQEMGGEEGSRAAYVCRLGPADV
jgi:hypothetical protein